MVVVAVIVIIFLIVQVRTLIEGEDLNSGKLQIPEINLPLASLYPTSLLKLYFFGDFK